MRILALVFSLLHVGRSELAASVEKDVKDPNLHLMEYDIGYGKQSTYVYVEPTMEAMYNGNPPASSKVVPKFNGLAVKFINMSNKHVRLSWEPRPGGRPNPMNKIAPFEASGTASFPTHSFIMTDPDTDKLLQRYAVQEYPENLYVWDPYEVKGNPKATEKNLSELSKDDRAKYQVWKDTILFNEVYRNYTGRSYLANYLRDPPRHFMWPGDYFGQEHWVESKETHFTEMPPRNVLTPVKEKGINRVLKEGESRALAEFRTPDQSTLNMTLKVISVAPRALEIPNFLSQTEVDHILHLAGGIKLSRSSVGDVGAGQSRAESKKTDTRTSHNAWVERGRSPVIDAIYRRAADVMRIDEALLRNRDTKEMPDWETKGSLAEHLQLVHYDPGQEYTAHHDFGFSDLSDLQGARYATLLLYLNGGGDDPLVGGETTFPRWVNAETFDKLKITPQEGKAVLFYSQLPDGNLDDFSQHSAEKPRAGDKWLINLWTWDPKYH